MVEGLQDILQDLRKIDVTAMRRRTAERRYEEILARLHAYRENKNLTVMEQLKASKFIRIMLQKIYNTGSKVDPGVRLPGAAFCSNSEPFNYSISTDASEDVFLEDEDLLEDEEELER